MHSFRTAGSVSLPFADGPRRAPDERTKRAIRSEISHRTKKAEANAGRYESQLADVRAKMERGTENLVGESRGQPRHFAVAGRLA